MQDNEGMDLAEQISELSPDELAAVTSLVEHYRQKKYETFVREKVALAEKTLQQVEKFHMMRSLQILIHI